MTIISHIVDLDISTPDTDARKPLPESKLLILQWNIEGLNRNCLKERTIEIVQEIKR